MSLREQPSTGVGPAWQSEENEMMLTFYYCLRYPMAMEKKKKNDRKRMRSERGA